MAINTYKKIETIVLPKLNVFKEDLTVTDKKILKTYHGAFLYGYRTSGTNILTLDINSIDYSFDEDAIRKYLSNSLYALTYPNQNFLYFDGENLKEINVDEVEKLFKEFEEKVMKRKEYIQNINIPDIAFDHYNLMKDFRKWKSIAINSDIPYGRRFRNYFDFEKVKKPKDFTISNGYNAVNETLKSIEKQLYKNLNIA